MQNVGKKNAKCREEECKIYGRRMQNVGEKNAKYRQDITLIEFG